MKHHKWFAVATVVLLAAVIVFAFRLELYQVVQGQFNSSQVNQNDLDLDQFLSGRTAMSLSAAQRAPASTTAASGPLRTSSVNPRYFADAAGQVVYLTGSHTWANFQDNGNGNPPPAFDYEKYLDFLQANNHNFFRLWTWEQSRWTLETSDDNYWFNPEGPYVRTGTDTALDGKAKWDLTRFNQAYFDRMRQRIVEAGERGMYVSIMLFDGWSVVSNQAPALNNPWKGHPYNVANNVNGINGDVNGDNNGSEVHTLATPAVTTLQEAYVKKVIDTVNDLDNVLYEIANEAPDTSLPWQYHLVDLIDAYQAAKPQQHPVGVTGRYEWNTNDLIASGAEWISPGGDYMWDPPAGDGRAVVIVDTDHLWGIGGDFVWVWKTFTRGLNPIFMDGYDGAAYGVGGQGFNFNASQWVKLRANMGYTRAYAQQVNLAAMTPRGDLCSTGYCLANPSGPSAEFIVFLPGPAAGFSVNLTGLNGTFAVEWLNPETGSKTAGSAVTGGGTVNFTAPFAFAVLYLKQQGGPTPTSTPVPPTATATSVPPTATATPTTPVVQFPSSPLLDNFNRPGSLIGANWGNQPSAFRLIGHQLHVPTSGVAIWRPTQFGLGQEAFFKLAAFDSTPGNAQEVGFVVRAELDGGDLLRGVTAVYAPGAGELRVDLYEKGKGRQAVGTPVKATLAPGDIFGVHAANDGKVTFFRNDVQLASVAVNAAALPSGGHIGVIVEVPAGAQQAVTIDNFGGGNATGGPPPPYTLQVSTSVVGQGTVTVEPSGVITCGQSVTVTAVPKAGWVFLGWTGDMINSDNPFVYDVYGSLNLVANYAEATQNPEFAIATGTDGSGTVQVSPSGPYPPGQIVKLAAIPSLGWRFQSWSGGLKGTDNPVHVPIQQDLTVTAGFVRSANVYLPQVAQRSPGNITGTSGSCE